ncbi:hypothetical protein HDU76_007481 [Blyttiomyces sp. JEL0837]|nr:hypothetical protein HDU76_007481 [Blyttiomyces sp. JEL0837]
MARYKKNNTVNTTGTTTTTSISDSEEQAYLTIAEIDDMSTQTFTSGLDMCIQLGWYPQVSESEEITREFLLLVKEHGIRPNTSISASSFVLVRMLAVKSIRSQIPKRIDQFRKVGKESDRTFDRFFEMFKSSNTLKWRKVGGKYIECRLVLEHVYVKPNFSGELDETCFPKKADTVISWNGGNPRIETKDIYLSRKSFWTPMEARLSELDPDREGEDLVRDPPESSSSEADSDELEDERDTSSSEADNDQEEASTTEKLRSSPEPVASSRKTKVVHASNRLKGKERMVHVGEAVRGRDHLSLRSESESNDGGDTKNRSTTESTARLRLHSELQKLKATVRKQRLQIEELQLDDIIDIDEIIEDPRRKVAKTGHADIGNGDSGIDVWRSLLSTAVTAATAAAIGIVTVILII